MVGRVRAWYLVAMVVLTIAYYALPRERPIIDGLIGLGSVVAIEFGVRRLRPQRHVGWRCLAAAVALLTIGDVYYGILELWTDGVVAYPSPPDAFYLLAYVPLTIGLLILGRPTTPRLDKTTLIDVASVTLAGSLIVWMTLVRPTIEGEQFSTAARIIAVSTWVSYIAVFAAGIRVVLAWRRNSAMRLLGAAAAAFLVSDFFYGQDVVQRDWTTGSTIDLGYLLFTVLCGAAALTLSMRDVASPGDAGHALGPLRLTLVTIGVLVAPSVLLVEASRGTVNTAVAVGVISILVSMLLLLRLWMTARAYQRRASVEHAARLASRAMVLAATPREVRVGAQDALIPLLTKAGVDVALISPYRRSGVDGEPSATTTAPVSRGGGTTEVTLPLSTTDSALVFTGPTSELAELTPLLRILTDQASLALHRISLMDAARAEERERYFRTLVTTSTDVILISHAGEVSYATPSAMTMFGRDVTGERFDDLVRPVAPRPGPSSWPDTVDGAEATVERPDGQATVLVHRRDLVGDPSVGGIVTTMRDVTAERALQRDLAYRASHDQLTDLGNARLWRETISAERERRTAGGDGVAVLFIDIDNFKAINDGYGHEAGDMVLAEVAARIRSCLRLEDFAARLGGDEFAVLLRGLSSVEDARAAARRLAEELARPVRIGNSVVDCGASVGLAFTPRPERVEALVGQADAALYAAKAAGKGHWREFQPGMSPGRPMAAASGG